MSVTTNKTIILKPLQQNQNQCASGGILKIDFLRQVATLSLPALAPSEDENTYLVFAKDSNNLNHLKIKNSKRQEITIKNNALSPSINSILVAIFQGDNGSTFLFGNAGDNGIKAKELIEYAKNIENKKATSPAQESKSPIMLKEEEGIKTLTNYDDEAIAECNYYIVSQEGENKNATHSEQDVSSFNTNLKNSAQEKNECTSSGYEASPCDTERKKEPEYYRTIKDKITPLFDKYPAIDALNAIIPYSRWIKIPFNANTHYVIATIKEKGIIKYLVYGVPGFYSSKPKGFESNSHFIPLSPFNLLGKGYWCVFQDANSGERIFSNSL